MVMGLCLSIFFYWYNEFIYREKICYFNHIRKAFNKKKKKKKKKNTTNLIMPQSRKDKSVVPRLASL